MTSGYDYDIGYVKIFKTPLSLGKKIDIQETLAPVYFRLTVSGMSVRQSFIYTLSLLYTHTRAHTNT